MNLGRNTFFIGFFAMCLPVISWAGEIPVINITDKTNPEIAELYKQYQDIQGKIDQIQSERVDKLGDNYRALKENEQSLENRTLTATTTAATGIGGMELAQGLAEQKADKTAEQSMTNYIATMRCKYGDTQVKAGLEEIELPGGNDSEMANLRNEYFALAADLKERKAALGMKPGIESEEILDKSEMGLYNNENIGISDGAYASLYRAQMYNSEKDKQEIDATKESTENRVVGGATAAGAGVVAGVVGNATINKDAPKNESDAINREYDKKLADATAEQKDIAAQLESAIAENANAVKQYNEELRQHQALVESINNSPENCRADFDDYIETISKLSPIENETDNVPNNLPDFDKQQEKLNECATPGSNDSDDVTSEVAETYEYNVEGDGDVVDFGSEQQLGTDGTECCSCSSESGSLTLSRTAKLSRAAAQVVQKSNDACCACPVSQKTSNTTKSGNSKITYKEACNDKKAKDVICKEDVFYRKVNGIDVTVEIAIKLSKEWAKVHKNDDIVCNKKPRSGFAGLNEYIQCKSRQKDIFYEFKFDDVKQRKPGEVYKDTIRGVGYIHDVAFKDSGCSLERIQHDSTCAVGYKTTDQAVCKKLNASLARFDMEASVSSVSRTSNEKFCVVGAITKQCLNDKYGLNTDAFKEIQYPYTPDLKQYVKSYVATQLKSKGKTLNSFDCGGFTPSYKYVQQLPVKNGDVLNCSVNGDNVCFKFEDLTEGANYSKNAALSRLACIKQGGKSDNKNCRGLDEKQCTELGKKLVARGVSGTHYDRVRGGCILDAARTERNVNLLGEIAAGVALTVITDGAATIPVLVSIGTDLAFEAVADWQRKIPYKDYKDFMSDVGKCLLDSSTFTIKDKQSMEVKYCLSVAMKNNYKLVVGQMSLLAPEDQKILATALADVVETIGQDTALRKASESDVSLIKSARDKASFGLLGLLFIFNPEKLVTERIAKLRYTIDKNFTKHLDDFKKSGSNTRFVKDAINKQDWEFLNKSLTNDGVELFEKDGYMLFRKVGSADGIGDFLSHSSTLRDLNAQGRLNWVTSSSLKGKQYLRINMGKNPNMQETEALISKLQSEGFYVSSNSAGGIKFIGVSRENIFGPWDKSPNNWLFNNADNAADVSKATTKADNVADAVTTTSKQKETTRPVLYNIDSQSGSEISKINKINDINNTNGNLTQKPIGFIREVGVNRDELPEIIKNLKKDGYRLEVVDDIDDTKMYRIFADNENDIEEAQKRLLETASSQSDKNARLAAVGNYYNPKFEADSFYNSYKESAKELLLNDPDVEKARQNWDNMNEYERWKFEHQTNRKIRRQLINEDASPVAYGRPDSGAGASYEPQRIGSEAEQTAKELDGYDKYNLNSNASFEDMMEHLVHENYHYAQDVGKTETPKWLMDYNLDNYTRDGAGGYGAYHQQPLEAGVKSLGRDVKDVFVEKNMTEKLDDLRKTSIELQFSDTPSQIKLGDDMHEFLNNPTSDNYEKFRSTAKRLKYEDETQEVIKSFDTNDFWDYTRSMAEKTDAAKQSNSGAQRLTSESNNNFSGFNLGDDVPQKTNETNDFVNFGKPKPTEPIKMSDFGSSKSSFNVGETGNASTSTVRPRPNTATQQGTTKRNTSGVKVGGSGRPNNTRAKTVSETTSLDWIQKGEEEGRARIDKFREKYDLSINGRKKYTREQWYEILDNELGYSDAEEAFKKDFKQGMRESYW